MKKTYEERLKIPLVKTVMSLHTKCGFLVATGYERIVLGKRGPYIEFVDDQIIRDNLHIPDDQMWRLTSLSYYDEYRTKVDNVKVYLQKRTVDYADYLIGRWYISPFDLRTDKLQELIEPLIRNFKNNGEGNGH